jgi:Protein kinase domain
MNDRDLVPDRLGPYRLLDWIGEGGMGVVYLARDPGQRTVALKVLRSSVAGEPTARRRLAREVETMQRVRSPYVAEVIDADLTGDMPYIVTRFVPGRTLDDLVTEGGPLRGPTLAKLAAGLAEALVAVHAAGVVHRDLKPGNVMLVRDTPVVIDFGIAQGPEATRLTTTGMFMGTPGYLAPEVIEGRPSSQASDVHAWGATVGFAATGHPPFGTGSYESIFYRIVNGQADLGGAPAPLLPLLAAALARDPAHRPTAVQLCAQAAVLDPATLVQPPVTAAVPETADVDRAGQTRSDVPAGAAAAAGAALAAGAGLAAGGAAATPVAGGAAARMAAPPGQPPGALGVPERPPGAGQVPDDLRDILTPVRYVRGGSTPAVRKNGADRQPGSGAAPEPTPAAPGAQVAAAGQERVTARARWHPVLVVAAVVVAASVSVILPVIGTVAALVLFAVLRASALVQRRTITRRLVRGSRATDPLIAAVSMPWFILRGLLALLLLAPFALAAAAVAAGVTVTVVPGGWPYRALAYAAGALVIFYGLGPGSGMSRGQLRRAFSSVTRTRTARAVVLAGMTVLVIAAVAAAVSWPSAYWPAALPGQFIHFGVVHLRPLRRFGLHHFALLRHIGMPRRLTQLPGLLLHHLGQLTT